MAFDPRRAAREIGSDAVSGAQWTARTLSSGAAWRRAGRSFKYSAVGSLINTLIGLLLVALVFAGFWLNDHLGVPELVLYAAGVGALCLAAWLNRQLWRRYTRSWTGRRKAGRRRGKSVSRSRGL